jgi:hypothetical protein
MKRQSALLVVALLAAAPAFASTFVAMSADELVSQADAVVVGQVIDRVSAWTESGRLIYTDNTVAVETVVIGEAAAFVTVRTFGGQVGDVIVEAHGFPKFEDGERVLLFLARDEEVGAIRVLGHQQGQFRVVTRLDGVTLAVPMVDEGARLLDLQGRPMPEPASVRLTELEAQVLRKAGELGRLHAN